MGREDAGVQLDVSRLVHAVDVSEGSGDAEVGRDGPQGLLYSPDLSPTKARRNKSVGGAQHRSTFIKIGVKVTRCDKIVPMLRYLPSLPAHEGLGKTKQNRVGALYICFIGVRIGWEYKNKTRIITGWKHSKQQNRTGWEHYKKTIVRTECMYKKKQEFEQGALKNKTK